ncbi:MAG: aldehyde dehydrogenase family protein [Candidatus Methanomethylicia archaeon]
MVILTPPRDFYGRLKLFINGGWVESKSSDGISIYDPGLGKIIGEYPYALKSEVDEAIESAYEAFKIWGCKSIPERLQYLYKIKFVLEENREILARVNTQNHGKTVRESRGDIRRTIENVEAAISMLLTLAKGEIQYNIAEGIDEELTFEPLGVFNVITPYNFPIMIPFWFIPYAIALGNTLIVKVSPVTPIPLTFTMELISQILPPGVLNLVHLSNDMVDYLVTHPLVEGTAFVGTSTVALKLYELSAKYGKRFLGGGSASNYAIVMSDANLEKTIMSLRDAKYGNTGQRCLAIQNIVTVGSDEFHEKFKNAFINAARGIKVGYGLDESVDMGPMASLRYKENVLKWIEVGLEEGAKIALDGRNLKVEDYPYGFYLGPTVMVDVTPDMKIAKEEIFGPVANLLKAESLDQAIEWINGNKYHHSAAIFTSSGRWAREFKTRVKVGNVGINIGIAAPMGWFPFGGRSLSGLGNFHPQIDTWQFFTDKKITIVRWW